MNVKHIHQVWGLKSNNISNTPLLIPPFPPSSNQSIII